jgi:hypothetical protein
MLPLAVVVDVEFDHLDPSGDFAPMRGFYNDLWRRRMDLGVDFETRSIGRRMQGSDSHRDGSSAGDVLVLSIAV